MSIPNQTFIPRPSPGLKQGCYPNSKHVRSAWMPQLNKLFLGGGDVGNTVTNDSGNQMFWYYDAGGNSNAGVWTLASAYCSTKGKVSPGAVEEGPVCWDGKRDVAWAKSAAGNIPANGAGHLCATSCPPGAPTGSTTSYGLFNFNPTTGDWTLVMDWNSLILAGGCFAYDSVHDELICTSGQTLSHYALSPGPSNTNPNNRSTTIPPVGFSEMDGGHQNGYVTPDCTYSVWGHDPLGRSLYMIIPTAHFTNGNPDYGAPRFWRYDIDTKVFSKLPDPPPPRGYAHWGDTRDGVKASCVGAETRAIFDTRNRALIWPFEQGPDGEVKEMYVWDTTLASPAWQVFGTINSYPTTKSDINPSGLPHHVVGDINGAAVCGNCISYDPYNNVVILGGAAFRVLTGGITQFWIWRYK